MHAQKATPVTLRSATRRHPRTNPLLRIDAPSPHDTAQPSPTLLPTKHKSQPPTKKTPKTPQHQAFYKTYQPLRTSQPFVKPASRRNHAPDYARPKPKKTTATHAPYNSPHPPPAPNSITEETKTTKPPRHRKHRQVDVVAKGSRVADYQILATPHAPSAGARVTTGRRSLSACAASSRSNRSLRELDLGRGVTHAKHPKTTQRQNPRFRPQTFRAPPQTPTLPGPPTQKLAR